MVLGAGALTATAALFSAELARVWRRGSAPLPAETGHLLEAGREATRETFAVFRQGYQATSPRENAVFDMFVAFALTFGSARAVTHLIRARGEVGPIKNLIIGERHVHHFIPGLVIAFLAGGISIGIRHEELDKWFALRSVRESLWFSTSPHSCCRSRMSTGRRRASLASRSPSPPSRSSRLWRSPCACSGGANQSS